MKTSKNVQNQFTNPFTKEELNWLKENFDKYKNFTILTEKLNEEFGKNRCCGTIKRKCYKELGLKKDEKRFTEEHKQFFKENVGKYTVEQITKLFNERFMQNRSPETIKVFCYKTLKLHFNSQASIDSRSEFFKRPIGSELKTSLGHILVKIDDKPKSTSKNWQLKERIVWEKHFGKIPPKHNIIFLDGNKENFAIENLRCVSNQIMPRIGKLKWWGLGKITEAGIEILETERIIKQKCL